MAHIGTRKMKIEIDAEEYSADVSNARFTSAENGDALTFAEALAGGRRDYVLAFTAVQDAAATTLWSKVFNSTGTDVVVTLMPYGNAVPSVSEPHFTATATIAEPDGDLIGGEANASPSNRFTFDCEWPCLSRPVRDTGA